MLDHSNASGRDEEAPLIERRDELTRWLGSKENEGSVVRTQLKASERVIARVTDGIYRQPASALRELISNAWDADANQVTILTDAPRFSRIYVRDDGAGMSYETLARLLHSIGGSAKRSEEGQKLGVTDEHDPDRTPGGRQLIGKIGIGLFSVSQLARRFRIVTKVRGNDYRLIAEVRLRAYSEDGEDDDHREADDKYVTGDVFIRREAAEDKESHGTDVIIDDVKPGVRDLLRSASRWRALKAKAEAEAAGDLDSAVHIRVEPPRYHTGWIENLSEQIDGPAVLTHAPRLPWNTDDPPNIRMRRLMEAVESEFSKRERPDLVNTLDAYLDMLWTLGLSVPVEYVDTHPFDLTSASGLRLFWINNEMRGQAQEVELRPGFTVRQAVAASVTGHPELEDGLEAPAGQFRVNIDGFDLKRPIRFNHKKADSRGLEHSMLFVGKWEPDLGRIAASQRGGDLAVEGYMFWTGRVIPKENNGVVIRIRGASGASFDPTFFKYQVSEQTRLRQITSELFIKQGLDAALNIDRESFNFSHPHVQLVTGWVHRAVRQLTNKHKEISKRAREGRREDDFAVSQSDVHKHAARVWMERQGDAPVPQVVIAADVGTAQRAREDGAIALLRPAVTVLSAVPEGDRRDREMKAAALIRVLAAYEVLSDRSYDEQQALIDAILQIFL